MGKGVCPICNNLSDNCMYCGGTNKTKEERGFSVCPTCYNQSDHCITCGGNSRLGKSKDEGNDAFVTGVNESVSD